MNLPVQPNIENLSPVKKSIASAALGLAINLFKTNNPNTPEGIEGQRRSWGYGLISISIVLLLVVLFCSISFIESLEPRSSAPYVFDYIRLSARAILTAAAAVFSYKMLRSGERMIIPLTLIKNTEDLKLLLGVNSTEPKSTLAIGENTIKSLDALTKSIESFVVNNNKTPPAEGLKTRI
jgi:hypothetical protein